MASASPDQPPPSYLSPTFQRLADALADHIALQCFLLASSDSAGLSPTRGFLLTGPPGSGKSSVLLHVSRRLSASHKAQILSISAVAGVRFFTKDDNQLKSFVRKHTADSVVDGSATRPLLLVLDDMSDVASYESLESARTLFLADLARFFASLEPRQPIALLASFSDSLTNPKPALFASSQTLPEISEPLRCEIMTTILSSLENSVTFNAAGLPTQSPDDGPLASFATHIAALTPGFTPRDLTLVTRQLVFLATSPPQAQTDPAPASPDTLATHLESTLTLSPTLRASHVPLALARVRPSLSVSQQYTRPVPPVTWTHVGGYADVVKQLRAAVVQPLRHPEAYARVGARAPRGVLLYGPPGCGKTTLVHALASEPGVNVVSVKGPELLSKYFGESESRLRALFQQARKSPPCILFFDEMDVIGVKRAWTSASAAGGSSEASSVNERVLSTLLNEMDGVSTQEGVVVVGCTNRPWAMDDALLRPGRLDQLVYVPLPSEHDRAEILKKMETRFEQGVDLDMVAKRTVGFTGGHLKALVREAGIKAMVKHGPGVEEVGWEQVVDAAQEMGVPLGMGKEDELQEDGSVQEEGDDDAGKWEDVGEEVSPRQRLRMSKQRVWEVEAPYVEFLNKRSAK